MIIFCVGKNVFVYQSIVAKYICALNVYAAAAGVFFLQQHVKAVIAVLIDLQKITYSFNLRWLNDVEIKCV